MTYRFGRATVCTGPFVPSSPSSFISHFSLQLFYSRSNRFCHFVIVLAIVFNQISREEGKAYGIL